MAPPPPQRPLSPLQIALRIFALGLLVDTARAQNSRNRTRPTTDPSEARALNIIFSRWGIESTNEWNISGELCSGNAIDSTEIININPGIKCDCSYSSNTICHISALRVYALDVGGTLPEELWNLTYLVDLDVRQNVLTGPIHASIGNLYRMQYMSFGINALSGELPRELGLLADLRSLSFSTNNFAGSLPPELGNLTRLEQIYFDSSGVSGPIPPTFANLRSLRTLWASDNELTGQIPDFIGTLSNLVSLRFQGNSFQSPIPSSSIGLTSLTELIMSDLVNGSSSLDPFRNLNSLSILVLRNNNISGSIPSFFSGFQNLILLDLSFNNLTGRIPDSLFNISSLTYLFLGNNMLTGELPSQKRPRLQNMDLSYNELSGIFPSWVSEQNLQLNLVANNFIFSNDNNNNVLPSGLNCLQRNFPCNRGQPIYSSFAVKCGGPEIRTSDGVVYQSDNATLGPATYYMTNTRRWAVSNVGWPINSNSPQYQSSWMGPTTTTVNPELFQSARISAGSLRYYGLGLENGNYTVRLQFSETIIPNATGYLEERDFNIQREALGTSYRAVLREFTAHVTENYLEIHLFWAGKGTCCVPAQGTYGLAISAISATPDFIPTVGNSPTDGNGRNRNQAGLIVGIVVAVGVTGLISLAALVNTLQKRKRQKNSEDEELLGIDARPYTYSYAELKAATDDFNPANKLGEGGFGPVYKGTLGDGRVVAVKQLSVSSRQGKSQFVAEIATISAVQHKNLVKLYGCCIEGDKRLLVYEFLENKSLDQVLFGIVNNDLYLDWPARLNICLGIARGLAYLHEESRIRIVHRDVKASNILLDSDLTPKISDFGLAKLYDDKMTHISTKVAGTIGYLAPEYAMRGHLTEKADLFSFGVVALEIISGRPNSDSSLQDDDKKYLLEWVWNLHERNREIELVDPTLNQVDETEAKRLIGVALLCTQASPAMRPSMSRVVAMLCGDIEVVSVTSKPGYLTDWNFTDATTFGRDIDSATFNNIDTFTTDPNYSPVNPENPMLHEINCEFR